MHERERVRGREKEDAKDKERERESERKSEREHICTVQREITCSTETGIGNIRGLDHQVMMLCAGVVCVCCATVGSFRAK